MEVTKLVCKNISKDYLIYKYKDMIMYIHNRDGTVLGDYDNHEYIDVRSKYGSLLACSIDGYSCKKIPEYINYFSLSYKKDFKKCTPVETVIFPKNSNIYELFTENENK